MRKLSLRLILMMVYIYNMAKIMVKQLRGSYEEILFSPINDAALFACYLAEKNVLTSKDLKALTLLGHEIIVVNQNKELRYG